MTGTAFASAVPLLITANRNNHGALSPRRRPSSLRRARVPLRACIEPDQPDVASSSSKPAAASVPRVSSAASAHASLNRALADAASQALAGLQPLSPNVAIVFISARYAVPVVGPRAADSLRLVVPKLRALLPDLDAVIGCCADGVAGADGSGGTREVERTPAVSVTLAHLPGIQARAFHVMPDDLPRVTSPPAAWHTLLGKPAASPDKSPSFLVFADPTFAEQGELDRFLAGLHATHPHASVAGAVASTGAAAGGGHLICTLPRDVLSSKQDALRDSGLVALQLSGDVELQALVAPCVRPVGPVFTACEAAAFSRAPRLPDLHLVGRPATRMSAFAQLRSVLDYATPEEKRLMGADLHVGFADPDASPEDGYVIRNVRLDAAAAAIAIGARVRPGQRVRFFVKDADAAREALQAIMQRYKRAELAKSLVGYANPPFLAAMFVDSDRGWGLFGEPGMESRTIESFVPGVPISGFFGSAQIGPARNGDFSNGDFGSKADDGPAVVHNAANVIVLIRRRSGLSPVNPPDSPPPPSV